MRLALLLLLIFGSIESYRVELYNEANIPVFVRKSRNGVESNVTLPAASTASPSSWNMTGLGDQATVLFVAENLMMQIEPTNPPKPKPSLTVNVWYLPLSTNTPLIQHVFLPVDWRNLTLPMPWFICNDMEWPATCVSIDTGPGTFLSTTFTYNATMKPFRIHYKKQRGYDVQLYNTADIPVTVQKLRNNVQTSVQLLPAASWTMTGLYAQDLVVFVMDNLVAQIQPSQTPKALDVSVRYLYDTVNTTLNQMVYFPGQSPGAPYSYTFLCNELYVPQQCLTSVGSGTAPSNFLSLTIPYDVNFQPFKIYYSKPKEYSVTVVNKYREPVTVWIFRGGVQFSKELPAKTGSLTMTDIRLTEPISFTMENLHASFGPPQNPVPNPPMVKVSVRYSTEATNTLVGMEVYDYSGSKIFVCNRNTDFMHPEWTTKACEKTGVNEASTQTTEFDYGGDYTISFYGPWRPFD